MKTAAKVFIILGMILQFYLIFPIIVGAIALSKLNAARAKSELTGIGICTLLLCSLLGGIFMLCISDAELVGATDGNSVKTEVREPASEKTEDNSAADELKNLKKLLDDGIIDEETYNEKRQKYVDLL